MLSYRYLVFLSSLSFAALLVTTSSVWAGSGGEGTPGEFHICQSGPSAGLECNTAADCSGSACVDTAFLPQLPRICQSGAAEGQTCEVDADCNNSRCVINFEATQPAEIRGTLILIVDDDETNLDTGGSCGAATVLLDVKKARRHHFLAQTYLCTTDTDFEVKFLRTEAGLNDAVVDASLLNRLLFREPDGDIAQALRDLFEAGGHPVVVGTPKRIKLSDHTDREADTLASVVRLQVVIRFVKD